MSPHGAAMLLLLMGAQTAPFVGAQHPLAPPTTGPATSATVASSPIAPVAKQGHPAAFVGSSHPLDKPLSVRAIPPRVIKATPPSGRPVHFVGAAHPLVVSSSVAQTPTIKDPPSSVSTTHPPIEIFALGGKKVTSAVKDMTTKGHPMRGGEAASEATFFDTTTPKPLMSSTDFGEYGVQVFSGTTLILEGIFLAHAGQPSPQHVVLEHAYVKGYEVAGKRTTLIPSVVDETFDGRLTMEPKKDGLNQVNYAVTLVRLDSMGTGGTKAEPFQVPHLSVPIHAEGQMTLAKGQSKSQPMTPSPYVLTITRKSDHGSLPTQPEGLPAPVQPVAQGQDVSPFLAIQSPRPVTPPCAWPVNGSASPMSLRWPPMKIGECPDRSSIFTPTPASWCQERDTKPDCFFSSWK